MDAYEVAQVKKAYPGTAAQLRGEMIDFVTELSAYAKAHKAGFLVVPQNAVGLLAADEGNPNVANTAYLKAIDGLGVEDLWYDGNSTADWTQDDLKYIKLAVNADKFVLATSYPTQDAKQDAFVTNAINAGLIPFVADRDLTGKIDSVNATIEGRLAGHDVNFPDISGGGSGGGGGDGGSGGTEALAFSIHENATKRDRGRGGGAAGQDHRRCGRELLRARRHRAPLQARARLRGAGGRGTEQRLRPDRERRRQDGDDLGHRHQRARRHPQRQRPWARR